MPTRRIGGLSKAAAMGEPRPSMSNVLCCSPRGPEGGTLVRTGARPPPPLPMTAGEIP